MNMRRRLSVLVLLTVSICSLYGCKSKNHEAVDLSSIHTEAAQETMAAETEKQPAVQVVETTASKKETAAAAHISSQIQNWSPEDNNNISIQYPVISNMNDSSKEEAVNKLLLANAISFYDALDADAAKAMTVDITCSVESLDRNRVTVVYEGTYVTDGGAYPVNLFYTNTVDLQQVKSLGINDYADAYTMAGYVMSDDVEFYQADAQLTESLKEYRSKQSIEYYTELFNQADFPLTTDGGDILFPESFSYMNKSVLYCSIPVPHALGDYAIVCIPIDGK